MTELVSPVASAEVQPRRFTSDEVRAMLLVEVADTTLAYDRDVKRPLYARAGIPEVWILDLEARHIEVHREPDDDVYRTRHLAGLDDTVTPERPASVGAVAVRDILGDLPEPESDSAAS
jgi:Uma2 family endonuclease